MSQTKRDLEKLLVGRKITKLNTYRAKNSGGDTLTYLSSVVLDNGDVVSLEVDEPEEISEYLVYPTKHGKT